jgi:hypothetical protein
VTTLAAGFMSKFPSLVTMRRDLVASVTLAVPGYRELLMWLGCVVGLYKLNAD